jgi:hypothetical protein
MVSQTGAGPSGQGYETPESRRESRLSQEGNETVAVAETGREKLTMQQLVESLKETNRSGEYVRQQDAVRYEVRRDRRISQDGSDIAEAASEADRKTTAYRIDRRGERLNIRERETNPATVANERVSRPHHVSSEEMRHATGENMSDLVSALTDALQLIQRQQEAAAPVGQAPPEYYAAGQAHTVLEPRQEDVRVYSRSQSVHRERERKRDIEGRIVGLRCRLVESLAPVVLWETLSSRLRYPQSSSQRAIAGCFGSHKC